MPLLYALIALNVAFGLYLFVSLRRSPEGFWDKANLDPKSRQPVTQTYQFYDAFSVRKIQTARSRSNTGQY